MSEIFSIYFVKTLFYLDLMAVNNELLHIEMCSEAWR